jgi:hypothetical protein
MRTSLSGAAAAGLMLGRSLLAPRTALAAKPRGRKLPNLYPN